MLDPLDDVANHASDTMAAGKGLCDETVVNMVVHEAPERIRELVTFGAHFDLKQDGEIALTQEGDTVTAESPTHSAMQLARK